MCSQFLRSASFRTSAATTATPFPYSPARAASTAALWANMFVWNEMSLMMLILSAISFIEFAESRAESTAITMSDVAFTEIRSAWLHYQHFVQCWQSFVP